MLTEPNFQDFNALVIDGNAMMRRAVVAQLRDLGVANVRQCKGLGDARLSLEQMVFDFVLCADQIEGSELSGQSLLEELRRDSVLPHSTVFVMLAGEATYAKVVEAAEAALDCLLLRPYKISDLAERLLVASRRKAELSAIFAALESGRHDLAVSASLQRYHAKLPYALHCARMAAEIQLKTGRIEEALALFQHLAHEHQLPWAQLGVARAQFAAGDTAAARRQVEALLSKNPSQAEAYDVLGQVQLDLGELKQALRTYHNVTEITPGCNLRLQHCGTLAFYVGDRELAVEMLDRAVALGPKSRLFDALTLLLLAFLRHDMGDHRRMANSHRLLQQFLQDYPQSRRLQRFELAAQALCALQARQLDEAQRIVLLLAAEAGEENFDLEAGNLVLALWVRLPARDVAAGQQDRLVRDIAMRFCVSKAITEVLVASVQRHEAISQTLRACQAEISALAEQAMKTAMQGAPQHAVADLLRHGASTRNARLIEMAGLLLQRHRERIANADELQVESTRLQASWCRPITHVAGIRRSGRSPGGLLLRGPRLAPGKEALPGCSASALPEPAPTATELAQSAG